MHSFTNVKYNTIEEYIDLLTSNEEFWVNKGKQTGAIPADGTFEDILKSISDEMGTEVGTLEELGKLYLQLSFGFTDYEYEIVKEYIIDSFEFILYNPDGEKMDTDHDENYDYEIDGRGNYIFKITINNKEYKFEINVDRYEIVNCSNSTAIAYDFDNKKYLNITSAQIDNDGTLIDVSEENIINTQKESYIDYNEYLEEDYIIKSMKIKCDNILIDGNIVKFPPV